MIERIFEQGLDFGNVVNILYLFYFYFSFKKNYKNIKRVKHQSKLTIIDNISSHCNLRVNYSE
jgi:hypothetical protein